MKSSFLLPMGLLNYIKSMEFIIGIRCVLYFSYRQHPWFVLYYTLHLDCCARCIGLVRTMHWIVARERILTAVTYPLDISLAVINEVFSFRTLILRLLIQWQMCNGRMNKNDQFSFFHFNIEPLYFENSIRSIKSFLRGKRSKLWLLKKQTIISFLISSFHFRICFEPNKNVQCSETKWEFYEKKKWTNNPQNNMVWHSD